VAVWCAVTWHRARRYSNKISVHYYVPGQDLTLTVLQLLSGYLNSPDAQQLAADAEIEVGQAGLTHGQRTRNATHFASCVTTCTQDRRS
jgi:hypothetical protein